MLGCQITSHSALHLYTNETLTTIYFQLRPILFKEFGIVLICWGWFVVMLYVVIHGSILGTHEVCFFFFFLQISEFHHHVRAERVSNTPSCTYEAPSWHISLVAYLIFKQLQQSSICQQGLRLYSYRESLFHILTSRFKMSCLGRWHVLPLQHKTRTFLLWGECATRQPNYS